MEDLHILECLCLVMLLTSVMMLEMTEVEETTL